MSIDPKTLYQACNPSATLNIAKPEDRKYYIDFSSVRSGKLIRELKQTITFSDQSSCQLFTGHIGCGKSTELLRLKAELEAENYHVVYFESSEDLDMGDIDITDILLLTARQISESLEEVGIDIRPSYFSKLFGDIKGFLKTEIELSAEAKFPLGLAKITAKTKNSPKIRSRLRDYLEARTDNILTSINEEVLEVGAHKLGEMGKSGLVVIVDNLDRIDDKEKPSGRRQPEYIFFDRGEQLKRLNCHLVYTFPLPLLFSNDAAMFNNRFGIRPKVLAMIPPRSRDGSPYEKGLELLRQMILARAFPDLEESDRLDLVGELFEDTQLLDKLCLASGGHVRSLLAFLLSCIIKETPPFSESILDEVIREYRNDLVIRITPDEWDLLRQVARDQSVAGEREYQTLLRSMFVFEYRDKQGIWFAVNPLLADMEQLGAGTSR